MSNSPKNGGINGLLVKAKNLQPRGGGSFKTQHFKLEEDSKQSQLLHAMEKRKEKKIAKQFTAKKKKNKKKNNNNNNNTIFL